MLDLLWDIISYPIAWLFLIAGAVAVGMGFVADALGFHHAAAYVAVATFLPLFAYLLFLAYRRDVALIKKIRNSANSAEK